MSAIIIDKFLYTDNSFSHYALTEDDELVSCVMHETLEGAEAELAELLAQTRQ